MFDITPFRNRQKDLLDYFDNFDREFFANTPNVFSAFKVDILDKGDKFILQAELPGFSKEDIKIDIDGDYLTISATHNAETEQKKDNFVRKERRYGSLSRSFNISNIKKQEISAEYKNGVLELGLPKENPEEVTQTHTIEIK